MSDSPTCEDKDGLLDYLYGEGDDPQRGRFERHLADCAACRQEVDELRGVRRQMTTWVPPADEVEFGIGPPTRAEETGAVARWGFAAAAVLVLAAGAAVTNLQLTVGAGGLTIRTGWMTAEPRTVTGTAPAPSGPESWQTALAALESRLRGELRAPTETPMVAAVDSSPAVERTDVDRRLRAMIAASEERQQRELALRMAQLTNEVEAQRRADLVRIEQGFGVLEGTAGAEAARQRELINYLVRVSQQR